MNKLYLLIIIITIFLTGCSTSSKKLIEKIESPSGKYEIRTYLRNCGATCDFGVSAELCDVHNNCKEFYYQYHESESFVYWIDDKNIFINQKKINVFKDKYNSVDSDAAFRLYRNIDYYKKMYLINNKDYEYLLTGYEADYVDEISTSIFTFDKNNIYQDHDFILRIVDLKTNSAIEYFLKINNNKMYIIYDNKMSELNRTDYEYLRKIMITNNLYEFD